MKLIEQTRRGTAIYYNLRWAGTDGGTRQETVGRTRKSGGTVTFREAKRARDEKQKALNNGVALRDPPKRRMTLQALLDHHREAVVNKVSGGTMIEYDIAGRHAVAALGADMPIDRIGPREIGRLESFLLSPPPAPKGRQRRAVTLSTVAKTLKTLRAIFARAVKWRMLASNPLSGWEMPKAGEKEARIYSRSDIAAMIDTAPTLWWEAFNPGGCRYRAPQNGNAPPSLGGR